MSGLRLGFIMADDTARIVLREMQDEVHALRPDQIQHVEHLIRSWRVPQGMLWEPAIRLIRKAIRKATGETP